MDASHSPKTDQRAGVRPISFLLDSHGTIGDPVTLPIRPTDLTRTEPSRATVHQSMGREVSGWVDHFGEGLPSVNISGHTGWGVKAASGQDGFQSFETLNELVVHRYPALRQRAIDEGKDPAGVKLLFVDLLDNFAWSVVPTTFVLRRSRSSPLLFQYNIVMQAISTAIDVQVIVRPDRGSVSSGLGALGSLMSKIKGFVATVQGLVARALGFVNSILGPIAAVIKSFVALTAGILGAVSAVVGSIKGAIGSVAGTLIGMARGIAQAGANVFRSLNAIINLPGDIKAALGQVAAAYHEMLCVLSNSLRPRRNYQEYSDLYGASNCSSTTGGRPASAYAGSNAFAQMQPEREAVALSSGALVGVSALSRMDPVLAPMPIPEMGRHMSNIVQGTRI